jgi:hypothetical protein
LPKNIVEKKARLKVETELGFDISIGDDWQNSNNLGLNSSHTSRTTSLNTALRGQLTHRIEKSPVVKLKKRTNRRTVVALSRSGVNTVGDVSAPLDTFGIAERINTLLRRANMPISRLARDHLGVDAQILRGLLRKPIAWDKCSHIRRGIYKCLNECTSKLPLDFS